MPQAITTPKAEAAEIATTSEEIPLRTKEDFIAYIEKEAPKYEVSPAKAEAIVACETGHTWNPEIVGDHGTSFGLAQLHDPWTKGLTIKEAETPKIALDYLIKHLADHSDHWSCEKLI